MDEMKNMIYNCRQATLLIEKQQWARLTIRERVQLKVHLTGCSMCKLFQRQSRLINEQVKKLIPRQGVMLDEPFKIAMEKKILEKLKENPDGL